MKTSALYKYLAAGALLFQFETALSADSGAKFSGSTATSRAVFEKVFTDLKTSKLTQKDLQKLGPGVTGGGDSCEQKIAYSYSFLLEMIENDKISASVFKADKDALLTHLKQTKFSFDRGLKKDRPVEMLNAPVINAILVDRELCNNNFEPLSYYAPLLMHETLRLAGLKEADADFSISKSYVGKIRQEADRQLNGNRRSFRVFSGTANGTIAMAWGMRGEPLDFEKFDELSEVDQRNYIDANIERLENYIVDLKRMRILAIVGQWDQSNCEDCNQYEEAFAEFGSVINYNHRSFEYQFDTENKVGFTIMENKWRQNIHRMFAVNNNQQLIGFCSEHCEHNIEQAAEKKLTKAQRKVLATLNNINYHYISKKTGNGFNWEVVIVGDNMKEDGYASYTAPMKLEFVNGNFKATFGSFKQSSYDQDSSL